MKPQLSKLPRRVGSGDPIKAADYNSLIDFVRGLYDENRANTLKPSADIAIRRDSSGTIPSLKSKSPGGGGSASSACPFGRITTYKVGSADKTGILGGIIYCGDKTFEVPNQEINLATAGDSLVWIELTCESNRDDDSEIFLPGIKTGEAPASEWERVTWSDTASYPDGESPTVTSGTGKIILPIGRLTIASGAATLQAAGCGHFRIQQCGGTLSFSRE
jgi:hypothetical protein